MATILIVDDLSANRKFLVTLLGHYGHRMLEAADGSQGLAAVQAEQPDLVITDVLMPIMDGYEFVRQLRLDPTTSGIPVVFNTAHYGGREARALALSLGVSHVLTKPAESAEVLKVVGQALSGQPDTRMPSAASPPWTAFDGQHLRLLTDKLSKSTEDLTAANVRLRALFNIGLELASERDFERLLHSVCVAAHDLFGASYLTLGVLDPNGLTLQRSLICFADATCRAADANWIKAGDSVSGILGTVIAKGRALRGHNPGGDPAKLQLPLLHPEVQAYLAAPIVSSTVVHGWICLVNNEGSAFTEDDEHLLVALAGQVGRVYELTYEITERKRGEAQLLMQSAALNAADDAIVITDRAGLIQLINPAFSDLTGYAAAEAAGKNLQELVKSGRHDPVFYRGMWETVLSGQVWRGEIVNRRKDGSLYTEEQAITPVRVGQGEISHFIAVKRDITERKRADEEIRDRAQLSALSAAVGLCLTQTGSLAQAMQGCAEALVTYLGAAFARIWTLDEREGVLELQASAGLYTHLNGPHGKVPLGQFKIGRIAQNRKPHLTNAVIGDSQVDQEWARREGMVAFAGHPLIVDGRVVGVMALFARHALSETVISALAPVADHMALGIERLRSAAALRTAEERVRFALEVAGVGIWDIDYTTGVLQWSGTLEAQYGLQPGTFGGTFEAFVERIHSDDRESVLEAVEKARKSGDDFSVLHRSIWPDGTVRWLSGAGRIFLGKDGEPIRGVGISQDITERRTLEEQYQQAQKMEAVGRLAGGVAHDFNNLLTAILGYCGLLLDDLDPGDPRSADIAEIQKAGTSAAGLTRQLLAFSRREIIEPELLDLNEVAARMQGLLGRLIREDVKIVLSLAPTRAPVRADRGQVEQIVMNLAVNARDAMPKGGTLTIETANIELDENYAETHLAVKPGPYVALTVTDTGAGMTTEVQAHLFEPFFTTKEPGKGTGLGLATVHGIVKQSGGSINVYSEVGRGTAFKVYLPRADAAEMVVAAPPTVARLHAGAETVLVVEDMSALRDLTKRLLERLGYMVLLAADADEALQLFERNPSIDVVLTDVVMPGVSGPELTSRLVEQRPALKVIFMSGYTDEAIVHHGVLNPGIAFLHKPFTAETLGQKIRDVLDR